MARMLVQAAERLAALLALPETPAERGVTPSRLLSLADEVMGDDLSRFPDGRMLIWDIARHDGYRIPEYPMAGCGDVKEFLADEGARDVPDWYRVHLGMERAAYDEIWRYQLVMARNRAYWRKVFAVPSQAFEASDPRLAKAVREWVLFSLGSATSADDPSLFKR